MHPPPGPQACPPGPIPWQRTAPARGRGRSRGGTETSTAPRAPPEYAVSDPEQALTYAIQHIAGDRAEIIEGVITPMSPPWAHESAAEIVRQQLSPRLRALGLVSGGAPLYLLVDRRSRSCTLFSDPGRLGYGVEDGPHPFGQPIRLPAPFDLEIDTGGL